MSRWIVMIVLSAVLVQFAGCGGGGKKEVSLDQQVKKALGEPDPGSRARKLAGLGEKQLKAGDLLGGEGTLNAAAEAAGQVEAPDAKASAFIVVGSAMGRAGKLTESKKAFREASKALEGVASAGPKAIAFAELGMATAQYLKNPDAAAEHLRNAEQAAETVELAITRTIAYTKIMSAYNKAERPSDAEATLTKAKEFIQGLMEPGQQVECLAELGDALAKAKNADESKARFDEAEKIAEDIKDDAVRGYAFLKLGTKLKQAGNPTDGRKALSKADDAAQKIKDSSTKNQLVSEIQAAIKP